MLRLGSTRAVVTLAALAALAPPTPAGSGAADQGSAPNARRYRVLVVVTALAVTGAFASFTYVSPFLTEVGGRRAR